MTGIFGACGWTRIRSSDAESRNHSGVTEWREEVIETRIGLGNDMM